MPAQSLHEELKQTRIYLRGFYIHVKIAQSKEGEKTEVSK